jgi:hypothetical protein
MAHKASQRYRRSLKLLEAFGRVKSNICKNSQLNPSFPGAEKGSLEKYVMCL